eukprot:scaffold20064_cov32-Tisochrysis_lutea.AAC.4
MANVDPSGIIHAAVRIFELHIRNIPLLRALCNAERIHHLLQASLRRTVPVWTVGMMAGSLERIR